MIQFLCVLTSTCLAPYLPPTDTSEGGMGSVGDAGCPGSPGCPRAWLCMDIQDACLEASGDANPRSLLGLPAPALVRCGASLKCHTGGLGSCLALVWLRMQLLSFSACLVGIKRFCLKVSCLARPNFPGPLRENGLLLWLMWPALGISEVLASSAAGIPEAKINPGHIAVCLLGPAVSGQSSFSQPLRTSMFVLWIMSKIFSCTWWEEYRKVCLLDILESEVLKAPL